MVDYILSNKKFLCKECRWRGNLKYQKGIGRFTSKNGKWFFENREVEIEIIPNCPSCNKSTLQSVIGGAPGVIFPLHDTDFTKSRERMQKGLYYDSPKSIRQRTTKESEDNDSR